MNVMLIGEPASGKSTLTREIVAKLSGPKQPFKFNTLTGAAFLDSKVLLIGRYVPGDPFPGTDRLSMKVIVDAEVFLETSDQYFPGFSWLLEGDRLANARFLEPFIKGGGKVLQIIASEKALEERHLKRGDNQSATWLKGRSTKQKNLFAKFPIEQLSNETPEDLVTTTDYVLHLLSTKSL